MPRQREQQAFLTTTICINTRSARFASRNRKLGLAAAVAVSGLVHVAAAQVFSVTNNSDTTATGSLRWAIGQANAYNGAATINIASPLTITLGTDLPIITNSFGLTINGNNAVIDGGSTSNTTGYRPFFFGVSTDTANANLPVTTSTAYALNGLTIRNAAARGGNGGKGYLAGGGGAGLGGAVFVNAGALTISNVNLQNNKAVGGNGGDYASASGGGGGGMGGKGGDGRLLQGSPRAGGGGGGFGPNANGANPDQPAGAGNFLGGQSGGSTQEGLPGGSNGGGGGAGNSNPDNGAGGGGGGVGGTVGTSVNELSSYSFGGQGGFGGGGGGSGDSSNSAIAVQFGHGAFGGGGGSDGYGGFGGGSGGYADSSKPTIPGFGGGGSAFGANDEFNDNSGNGGGGGGAGLGGAIFVRQGATINVVGGTLTGNTVTGGKGDIGAIQVGDANGDDGKGLGQAIFLAGNAKFTVNAGQTSTLSDTLGGGTDALISGQLIKAGTGSLVLTSPANSYAGGTTVLDGTLTLGATNALPVAENVVIGGDPAGAPVLDVNGATQRVGTVLIYTQLNGANATQPAVLLRGGIMPIDSSILAARLPFDNASKIVVSTGDTGYFDLENGSRDFMLGLAGQSGTGPDFTVDGTVRSGTLNHTGSSDGVLTLAGAVSNTGLNLNAGVGLTVLGKTTSTATAVDNIVGIAAGATVRLGGPTVGNQIASAGSVLMTGGTFDLNGTSEGFDQLNGTGTLTNSASTVGTLTLGQNNGSSIVPAITPGSGLEIDKTGTGTMLISGTAQQATLTLRALGGITTLANTGGANAYAVAGIRDIAAGAKVVLGGGTSDDQISDIGSVNFSGGVLEMNGRSEEVRVLLGDAGTVTNNGTTASKLSLFTNEAGTFGGTIQSGTQQLNLFKTGSGQQTLTGAISVGSIEIGAGRLQVAGQVISSPIKIDNSGSLAVLPNSPKALKLTGAVTIPFFTYVDVNNSALIFGSTTGVSKPALQTMANTARDGGLWDSFGLTSTYAKSNSATGVGIVSGAQYASVNGGTTSFAGQSFGSADTLVKYTYNGDADLNGKVDSADYHQIDSGYQNQHNANFVFDWFNGDFDYNGTINSQDYALIDQAYQLQSGSLKAAINFLETGTQPTGTIPDSLAEVVTHYNEFGVGYANAFVFNAVPEPAMLSIITAGVCGLSVTRRHRRTRTAVSN